MDKELKNLRQQIEKDWVRDALATDRKREVLLKSLTPEQRQAFEEANAISVSGMLAPLPQKIKRCGAHGEACRRGASGEGKEASKE